MEFQGKEPKAGPRHRHSRIGHVKRFTWRNSNFCRSCNQLLSMSRPTWYSAGPTFHRFTYQSTSKVPSGSSENTKYSTTLNLGAQKFQLHIHSLFAHYRESPRMWDSPFFRLARGSQRSAQELTASPEGRKCLPKRYYQHSSLLKPPESLYCILRLDIAVQASCKRISFCSCREMLVIYYRFSR